MMPRYIVGRFFTEDSLRAWLNANANDYDLHSVTPWGASVVAVMVRPLGPPTDHLRTSSMTP